MIRRLEIENFYSIRETQIIDLTIGEKVPDEESRFAKLRDGSGARVPKAIAFFGANASGKSTALRSLAFLSWFLCDSIRHPADSPLPIERFADGNHDPIRIAVFFDFEEGLSFPDDQRSENPSFSLYSYEVRLGDSGPRSRIVLSEELRRVPTKGKSSGLFSRGLADGVPLCSGPLLKGISHLLPTLRHSSSLVSVVGQFAENSKLNLLYEWARGIVANVGGDGSLDGDDVSIEFYRRHREDIFVLNSALARLDTGIQHMYLDPQTQMPQFSHFGLARSLALKEQSEGTKQFFRIFPKIWQARQKGGVAVIDEIDSEVHPLILPAIMNWFYDRAVNPLLAQLWISGHSSSLLEDLRKEEIFFTEKDGEGKTSVFGLKDIERTRRSENFYQKYMGGVYGAVPRIG